VDYELPQGFSLGDEGQEKNGGGVAAWLSLIGVNLFRCEEV